MKAAVSIPFEAVDPLVDCLPGDAETLCQFGNGGSVQSVVLEESLSLFHHSNTLPGHGLRLLHQVSIYPCLDHLCYRCLNNFL
jgi:hypothetical protein